MDKNLGRTFEHLPVLGVEAVAALQPAAGRIFVDATFGGGGYSRALLGAADCRVIGVDRDPEAVIRGRALAAIDPRFTMIDGRFGELDRHLDALGLAAMDGLVVDLGLSSFQLDEPQRGFGFGQDGPLDMRMERAGRSAADLLREADADELADMFHRYGDEPQAGRIARAIVARRRTAPLARTAELRTLVASVKGRAGGDKRHHDPATLVFQALRIAVNDEFGELHRLLEIATQRLRPGGRLVAVSFHSGEDRIIKQTIDGLGARSRNPSRHLPPGPSAPAVFAWVGRGVVRAGAAEIARNPRARSAKLRVAVRLATPEEPAEPLESDRQFRWAA